MVEIRTVLCPVDLSTLTGPELRLAVEICRVFDARLVLHHNLEAAPTPLSKGWEWSKTHPHEEEKEGAARRRLEEILAEVPADVSAQAELSRGLVVPVLLAVAGRLPADLLVLATHGRSDEEHASVVERLLESTPCPILTIQEGRAEQSPRLHGLAENETIPVLVPTDFSPSAAEATAFAFELARKLPLELHLLHVLARHRAATTVAIDRIAPAGERLDSVVSDTEEHLAALVPEGFGRERVVLHTEFGGAADGIMRAAREIEPAFLVMGGHAPEFFRHFFTRDTSQEMLHRAHWPVWFVPHGTLPGAVPTRREQQPATGG